MKRVKQIKIPGKRVGMSIPIVPVAAPVAVASVCTPSVEGLYWFRDGVYSETLQTALFFGDGAVNPKLTTARLLGALCDQTVVWSAIWENADGGDDGAPQVWPLGADLDVAAAPDTKEGLLTVRAAVDGVVYGPIDLILFQGCSGAYYDYASSCEETYRFDGFLWEPYSSVLWIDADEKVWVHTAAVKGIFPENTTFEFFFYSETYTLSYFTNDKSVTVYNMGSDNPSYFTVEVKITRENGEEQTEIAELVFQ